ncbi:MAG: 4Fe-4S binding protein [Actinobacteria bacterium]|nr:4Fe-4S binding protein [Actinomycetota bacterium]
MKKVIALLTGIPATISTAIAAAFALRHIRKPHLDYIRQTGLHRIDRWPHGIVYFTHLKDYLRLGRLVMYFADLLPYLPKKLFADTYHGKLVPLQEAVNLVSIDEDVVATNLERIVPYNICKDIILEHPAELAVARCVCRETSKNHCHPDEVCLFVGEPYVSMIAASKNNPGRKITVEEAVEILKQTDEAGCLHAAFFKDIVGGKFFAICNCCKCCCVAIEGSRYKDVPFFGHSGLMPVFHAGSCTSCGKCVEACPFGALSMVKKGVPAVDLEACMGCAVCNSVCKSDAVGLAKAPNRPEPLLIDELIKTSA